MKTMIIPPRWDPNKRKTNVFGPNGRIGGMISGGNGVRIVRMGGALSVRGVGTGTVKQTVKPVVKPEVKAEVKAEETKPIEKPVEAVTEKPVTEKPIPAVGEYAPASLAEETAKDTAAAIGNPWEGLDYSELSGTAAHRQGEPQVSEPNRKGKRGRRRKNRRG